MAASNAPWAIPTACAPIPIRPPFSVDSAILNPCPNFPNKFSLGILQFSNTSSIVVEERMPIFASFLPKLKPGNPFSTINTLIPRLPWDLSVMAVIT